MTEFALYRGDELLCIGTAEECAERIGVKPDTVRYYASPCYNRRVAAREAEGSSGLVVAVRIDEGGEDGR